MGASQNFTLRPVHAHVNLLGWTTMALAGLIYSVFPKAGESRLARLHFWLLNLALPVMMGALTMLLLGHTAIAPVLAISEIIGALAILAFAANLFLNLKQ
jgi:cbb3-type cytochrome oxidase subunit 1